MKMINYNSKKSLLYNSTNNLALSIAVHPKSASDIKKVDEKLLEFASQLYESDSTGKALGSSALNYQGNQI